MISFPQLPVPWFPTLFFPTKRKGSLERVDPVDRHLPQRPPAPGEAEAHRVSCRTVAHKQLSGRLGNREEKKLAEDFFGILEKKVFVMVPAIRIGFRDIAGKGFPVAIFERLQPMELVETDLAFRLPEHAAVDDANQA